MAPSDHYLAYGTTRQGHLHGRALAGLLGAPIARVRTVEAHGIVVPRDAACSNPGCGYLHRMAALVRGHWDLHPEGDLYAVDAAALAALDRLELAGPYARDTVEVADGERRWTAITYPPAEPLRWAELVWSGLADALDTYPRELAEATPKDCCLREPGHAGPHDVRDPLDPARLADQRLRNTVLGYVRGGGSLHLLEATAGVTPWPNELAPRIMAAVIDWRHSGADTADLRARLARELDRG